LTNPLAIKAGQLIDLSAYMLGNFKPVLVHLPPTSR
jgi:hypothetical protein